jgi:hypothetical protein
MAILIEPPGSWSELTNKPTILADSQISWSEITNKPTNLTFLDTNPGNWQPWVLSSYYGQYLEWLPLTSNPGAWTLTQRDGSGRVVGANFRATAIPTSSTGLSAGSFYSDGGFVKVV